MVLRPLKEDIKISYKSLTEVRQRAGTPGCIHHDSQVNANFLCICLYTIISWPVSALLSGSFWNTPDGISTPSTGLRPSMTRASFLVDTSRRHPSKHTFLAPPIGSKLPVVTFKAEPNKGWNVDWLVKLSTSLSQHSSRPVQSHTPQVLYCRVLLHKIGKVFLCQSTSWSVGRLPGWLS